MKAILILALATFITATASAQHNAKIGPAGGRVLAFSKDNSKHGEVTVKEGKFHVSLLDQSMKPVKVDQQALTATGGTREKPEKLAVEKTDKGFAVPLVKEGQWLILQYKETPDAKAVTARLEYDTKTCGECAKAEWLCSCAGGK